MTSAKIVRPLRQRIYWDQSVVSGRLFQAGNGNYVSSVVYTGDLVHDTGPKARHAPLLDIDQKASVTYRRGGEVWLKFTTPLTPEGAAALEAFLKAHRWGRVSRHRRSIAFTVPVTLVPSTTKGHFHLYIDATLSSSDHQRLIECCRYAGLIEENYAAMVKKLGKGLLLRQGRPRTIVSRYQKVSHKDKTPPRSPVAHD